MRALLVDRSGWLGRTSAVLETLSNTKPRTQQQSEKADDPIQDKQNWPHGVVTGRPDVII